MPDPGRVGTKKLPNAEWLMDPVAAEILDNNQGKAATEPREAPGVRGACSRFWARWVARKRQQAGRTPNASRGPPGQQHSRSDLLLKGQWLFALPLAPGFLL